MVTNLMRITSSNCACFSEIRGTLALARQLLWHYTFEAKGQGGPP